MTQNLTKDFIDLSSRCLSPNRTAELSLNHGEGSFDIRPLVIMLHKGFLIKVIEMPHTTPQPVKLMMMVSLTSGTNLEGDISRATHRLHRMEIAPVGVCLVCGDLIDSECLGSLINKSGELNVISRCVRGSFSTSNDMGFDSAHDMSFHPSLHTALLAIFMVKPSGVGAGREARGVNGKVGFDCPQRAGGLLNEGFQQGCQVGILQIAECTIIVGSFGNQPCISSLFQLSCKSPSGHRCIGLEHQPEHNISQWQPRATKPILWLFNAVTEVSEQGDKMLLLMGLSLIIGRPLLGASHSDRLRIDGAAVWLGLPLDYELNGVDVLAGQMPFFIIGAGAERLAVVEVNNIASVARLGRHFPAQLVLLYLACVGYYQPSFLSCIHLNSPLSTTPFGIYNTIHCMGLSIGFPAILKQILKIAPFPIDNGILCMVLCPKMNDVQTKVAQLEEKGWTLAAIADEIEVSHNTVEKWKAGTRYPSLDKPVLDALNRLLKRNRIPKKKRYQKGSRRREVIDGT